METIITKSRNSNIYKYNTWNKYLADGPDSWLEIADRRDHELDKRPIESV